MRRPTALPFLLAACGGAGPDWLPVREVDVEPAQLQRAAAARDALASRLLGELQQALADGGPERAIDVCRERAPALAREVAVAQQVAIGRTSFALRNPANAAPPWAAVLAAMRADAPAFRRGPEGRLGALYPIRLGDRCAVCHGRAEQIAPGVRAMLAQHYPQDRATGFAPGDLRGWFWVEVPAR